MNLFQEALNRYQTEGSGFFEVLIHSNLNGLKSISNVFERTLEFMINDQERKGCMFINCHTEMGNQNIQLNNLTSENHKLLVSHFTTMVKKGQLDGSITSKQNSEDLAIYLASSFQGFRITGMNTTNKNALVSVIENVLNNLE